jgi:alkyl sulfatase BDS1-like metallo-beta-lactamase superfamily hydrolase
MLKSLARNILVVTLALSTSVAVLAEGDVESTVADPTRHFHPLGKPPSEHTLKILDEARGTMPFDDTRDFDEAREGFIAPLQTKVVMADAGNVAWNIERYAFLAADEAWPSVHPSTQRQGHLNQITGLFEVTDGIYQVRGFDLANITFVRGDEGWIVFDPLTARETARAGLELINSEIEELPVTAVIYSHSHGDHFGGVRGVVDPDRLAAGKVEIIAPRGFMSEAISENVYAGNAMNRRLFLQYGVLLPASPFGHAGQGLMQNIAIGSVGLLPPTRVIDAYLEEFEVDGVRMIFQNTPNTEAPSEMNTYLPDKKALWMAENVTGTIHNIYTLRGAQVRDSLVWSKFISRALFLFGKEAEVMFASHHWPRWGNERILEVMEGQRDAYAHLNNQVLHYANQGVSISQIHNVYEVPEGLEDAWFARGYHGSPEHNSRGVVQRFLGYWDGNPTNLIPLSPEDSAPLFVEMMGADNILRRGRELHDEGKYFHAQEILDKLVWAEPDNREARELLADVWEQIGYQQENPGLRNSFLAGAFELRSGIPEGAPPNSSGPDMISAMSTGLFLDFIGIRMDSKKAEALGTHKMNLITPDNDEKYAIDLSNGVFTNVEGFLHEEPDLSITINRADLEKVMGGVKSFSAMIEDGIATAEGDVGLLTGIASTLTTFEIGFEFLPGTANRPGQGEGTDDNPYQVIEDSIQIRGE